MSSYIERRSLFSHAGSYLATASLAALGMSSKSSKASQLGPVKTRNVDYGSKIGLIAPATVIDRKSVQYAANNIRELGFDVKIGRNIDRKFGYLAGTDKERADDFNEMVSDDSVDAIWCVKGGWGSARILDLIDYDAIKRDPKKIIGYSDITSLLNAIYLKTGVMTLHGPNAIYSSSSYTEDCLLEVLLSNKSGVFENHPDASTKTIVSGRATGRLVGGNLSIVVSSMGTSYQPLFEGSLLFLEDVSEPAYKVDRMLTQLRLCGVFEMIKGIIFGTCARCKGDPESFTVEEVLDLQLGSLPVPVYSGASIGHVTHKMTIPIGSIASMDADSGLLRIDDPMIV